MPEWLYEEGIGENRAILVEGDVILEAAIETPGTPQVGAIVTGRLRDLIPQRGHAWISTRDGDVLVRDTPKGITTGQIVRVEIVREEILEPGHPKSLIGKITEEPARDGPALAERIGAHTYVDSAAPDRFEQAGWFELLEEAISGDVPFAGGQLRLSLTPAMTLIDVDGWLSLTELAEEGAKAAARTIRRHGIAGSIGIDLPTVTSREVRKRVAAAIDMILPQPFERTAMNGFGFLQIVRKRERQSLPEMLQNAPVESAARALMRRAERAPGLGARMIIASPEVISLLEARPAWIDELQRRIGANVRLQAKSSFTSWSFHVQAVQS